MLLEISQNSRENTCARVSFLIKLQAEVCNFIKKEILAQVFYCEFCEISRNTFSYRTPSVAASDITQKKYLNTNMMPRNMEYYERTKLPRRITDNKFNIFDRRKITNEFHASFTNIGSKFASKIPNASTTFESCINKPDSIVETKQLSMNELRDTIFSLKINKSSGYHDISLNVLNKYFSSLREPLKYMFNLSIEKGIFPDDLKIADKSDLSNYRPTSVFSCFSKILERIMCNRLC